MLNNFLCLPVFYYHSSDRFCPLNHIPFFLRMPFHVLFFSRPSSYFVDMILRAFPFQCSPCSTCALAHIRHFPYSSGATPSSTTTSAARPRLARMLLVASTSSSSLVSSALTRLYVQCRECDLFLNMTCHTVVGSGTVHNFVLRRAPCTMGAQSLYFSLAHIISSPFHHPLLLFLLLLLFQIATYQESIENGTWWGYKPETEKN